MKRIAIGVALLLPVLALAPAPAGAADEGESGYEGSASLGGHISATDGYVGRVSRYALARDTWQPDALLQIMAFSGATRLDLDLEYEDEKTQQLRTRLNAGPYVDARLDHRSFWRWSDHDRLENLFWRERVGVDSLGNDVPGGKMITSEDTDPDGTYGWRYSDVHQAVRAHLPVEGLRASLLADYREQRREGHKQVRGVDHCANCHVRGQRAVVSELTQEGGVGLDGGGGIVDLQYEFAGRRLDPLAPRTTNRFMQARHPVNGGSAEEFASRLIYENEDLVISQVPRLEKYGHSVRASVDVAKAQEILGSFSYSETKNKQTSLSLKANAASLGWHAPIAKKAKVRASLTRRELDATTVGIDLPLWRDGRPGGGQDFDWTRYSAYDREEWIGLASASWAVRPGQNLRLDYRLHSTDRENVRLDPEKDETRTLQHRVRATWNGRLGSQARSRAWVEYEATDYPFVSVGGLCEEAIGDSASIGGQPNDWVYYWQRERFGTGGNRPTKAVRGNAYLSYGLGARSSVTGWVTVSQEKNDELNIYDFESNSVAPGVAAYWIPADTWVIGGGVSYGLYDSNAKICATVMDG